MKNLYLIRHGKSDWDADYDQDHNRPLNTRGRRDAAKIGAYLKRASIQPDKILCSSALRTQQTLELMSAEAGWRSDIQIEQRLYLAAPDEVMHFIAAQASSVDTLAVIGHRPFTGEVAQRFLGGLHMEVPTACVIGIEFDALHWADVIEDQGRLLMHLLPRRLD